MSSDKDITSLFTTADGCLLLLQILWGSCIFGFVMSIIAWIGKRKQKMEEKDDLNELMRKYLEKKMREEEEINSTENNTL